MDSSTTLIGLACAGSGGSRVLILGDSQGKAQQASMESLPADIVLEILSRVPAESVFVCKLVCKKWVNLIRGSNFANMHLSRLFNRLHDDDDSNDNLAPKVEPCLFFACRFDNIDQHKTLLYHGGQVSDRYIYSQNLNRIYHAPMHTNSISDHFVGSCNGLVCTYQLHDAILDPIYICNPLTREYVHLPQLVVNKEDVDPDLILNGEVNLIYDMACGFGYARSTNEYKVVRIHYLDYDEGEVEVYTLGSGYGWRGIDRLPYRLNSTSRGTGTYANDAIYWISDDEVVAFDLADEEFRFLPSVPPCLQYRMVRNRCGLVALGRHLCLYLDDKLRVEIWSLIKSSDSKETWRKEFDIDYAAVAMGSGVRMLQPILLTKKGEVIFLYAGSVLYSYDPNTTILNMISNKASDYFFKDVEAIAHVDTFESFEAMGENSKRYRVRPRRVRTPWDDIIDELDRVALGEEIDTMRYRLGSSTL